MSEYDSVVADRLGNGRSTMALARGRGWVRTADCADGDDADVTEGVDEVDRDLVCERAIVIVATSPSPTSAAS